MAIKILSVDDELDLEILLTQYFRRKIKKGEYEFHFAHNGLEALQMLLAMPDFDVILSDINMPEMDGLTLLTKINEMRNPALKCIMVSAYGDMENIRSAMNQGAFDFTTKPINLEDLERTIEKADRFHQAGTKGTHTIGIHPERPACRPGNPANNPAQDIPSVSGVEIVRLVCLYERSQICRRGFL